MMNSDKLGSIIQYASVHVPYYKRLFEKNRIDVFSQSIQDYYSSIPILQKDTVLYDAELFLSDEFSRDELILDRTSGSTGKILDIYWNNQDRIRSLLSLWAARKTLHNILPTSKCCYFHSIAYRTATSYSGKEVFSPRVMVRDGGLVLSLGKLSLDERTLEVYYRKIFEFDPEWMMCHPSTLYMFANYIKKTNKDKFKNLRFAELTGEYLLKYQRETIVEVLGVDTANHYGAKEVNGIAYECQCGHLHCLDNNVYVEIMDGTKNVGYDTVGHVCITGLNNRSMPFIRYDLGDIGVLRNGSTCKCGNPTPYLELSAARSNKEIQINGRTIDSVVFFYIVEWINAHLNCIITQFQITRTSISEFIVRMVLSEKKADLIPTIKSEFIEKASEYGLFGCGWDFSFVDIIPPQRDTQKLSYYHDVRDSQ